MTSDDFYSCSYSRATTYYIGSALGVLVGVLIMITPISVLWRYIVAIGAVAFFAGSALYYDITGKEKQTGGDVKKQNE